MRDTKNSISMAAGLEEYRNSLVVDLGTASTKCGWAGHGEPDLVVPSVVGRGRHPGAMAALGLKNTYVGAEAQEFRGILSLHQPFRQGNVQNWDDLEALWDFLWTSSSSSSSGSGSSSSGTTPAAAADVNVLVSVPPLCSAEDWRRLAELLLETYGFGGVYLANKSVLSMYGGGRTTGICVDSGEDMTYVVPCWEGTPLPDATLILQLGGKHVTDRLLHLLAHGKYSFPDDTHLLCHRSSSSAAVKAGGGGDPAARKKGNVGLRTMSASRKICLASKRDVVQEAKERFCKFSDRPIVASGSSLCSVDDEQSLRLPDGNMVVVGEEAMTAPELMFQPDLANKKCCSSGVGLHQLVLESLMRCDEKLRARLLTNVVLSGGNTMIPNLDVRLQKELTQLLPAAGTSGTATTVRVHSQRGRDNFTWSGGAHLTSHGSFQQLWLTKQGYTEDGANMNVQESNVFEQKLG